MKREKNRGRKGNRKKRSPLFLPHARNLWSLQCAGRGYAATRHRGVTKSCTASTTCDSDPTRVRGVTPTLSKLRGVVESETLVKNVSIQQKTQTP